MAENVEFLPLFAGFLVIMNGAVVQIESAQKCYNNTGNRVCFFADDGRDQRLKNWSSAVEYCRSSKNASLPTVMSPQDQFYLTDFLTENDFLLDSVWLGGRGVSNGFKWTWIDGSVFSGTLNTSKLDPSFAAVTDEPIDRNASLVGLSLRAEADGYICQYKGKTVCNGSSPNANYSEDGSCFASFGESINWFLARNKCLIRGADLATLTDTSAAGLKRMLERLNYKPPEKSEKWKEYWIGLRKIWWKWVDDNTEVNKTYFKDNPSLENLNSADQNCLTIDYKNQFAWSIRDCSIAFQTICQDGKTPMVDVTTLPTSDATTPTVALPVWVVGLISGLAGLIYIVSLIVVGVICWKCCRKHTQENRDSDDVTGKRRKNSYGAEPKGHQGPQASIEEGFDGVYPEGEFDDYDSIEEEKKSSAEYANQKQISNPKRMVRPR